MKLWQLIDDAVGIYGARFQTPPHAALRLASQAQRLAFNKDCRAFERRAKLISFYRKSNAPESSFCAFPEDCRMLIEVLNAKAGSYRADDIARTIEIGEPRALEILYYVRPPELTCKGIADIDYAFLHGTLAEREALFSEEDEAKVLVPDEWRWQAIGMPMAAMQDTQNYGDKTPQQILEGYFREWWQAMDARPQDRKPICSEGAW